VIGNKYKKLRNNFFNMFDEFQYRRLPAKEKKIADISPDDVRVRLLGRVIDKTENVLVIDDGTGKAEIVMDNETDVGPGDFVRVFARILPLEDGYELRSEIIQNMNSLNIDLYKKIKENN